MKTLTLFFLLGLLCTACGKDTEESKHHDGKNPKSNTLLDQNSPANELVASAVMIGDIASVRIALERGANVNLMLSSGATLLTHAISSNYPALVDFLLEQGAEPSRRDKNGRVPILFAMFLNRPMMARSLVTYGANIDATDGQGRSVLMLAIDLEDTEAAEWFIQQGADLDVVDHEGKNAATLARDHGLTNLYNAIDLQMNVSSGATSEELLRRIFEQVDVDALRLALQRSPSVLRMPLPTGPLFQAVQGARTSKILEMVQLILDQGLPADGQPTDPRSPLSEAAARGLVDVSELLMIRGADLEYRDALGWTPLIHAVRGNQPATVAKLLERGAKLSYTYLMNDRPTVMNACSFMREIRPETELDKDRLKELRRTLQCARPRFLLF